MSCREVGWESTSAKPRSLQASTCACKGRGQRAPKDVPAAVVEEPGWAPTLVQT